MSSVPDDMLPLLSAFQRDFIEIEMGRGLDAYRRRVDFIGLSGHGSVLDAGGGIGQWAMALAQTCGHVDVVDISSERLFIGREIAAREGIRNLEFRHGALEALPFEDNTFDAVICYSVFMFANGDVAMKEFRRVLKPGGKLYIMVDLWRWYADLVKNGKMRAKGIVAFTAKKLLGHGPALYTRESFGALVGRHGFMIVSEGQEGSAHFGDTTAVTQPVAFYDTHPPSQERLWEVCARNEKAK